MNYVIGITILVVLIIKQFFINKIDSKHFISHSALHGIIITLILVSIGWVFSSLQIIQITIFGAIMDFLMNMMMRVDFQNNFHKKMNVYLNTLLLIILYFSVSFMITLTLGK